MVVIIVVVIVAIVLIAFIKKILIQNYLLNQFQMGLVGVDHELTKEYTQLIHDKAIDETTFNDCEMNLVLNKINHTISEIGNEYLYSRFFKNKNDFKIQEVIIENLNDKKKLQSALYILNRLNKEYIPILSIKSKLSKYPSKYKYVFIGLVIINILSIMYAIFNFDAFYIPLLLSIICILLTFHFNSKYEQIGLQVRTIKGMLSASEKMMKIGVFPSEQCLQINQATHFLKAIIRFAYYFNMIESIDFIGISSLIRSIFLVDIIQTARLQKYIDEVEDNIITLYEWIGLLDICINIKLIRSLYDTCIPETTDEKMIEIKNGYHILIDKPVKNSVILNNNTIVTGSNASGKSTFLKMLGANLLLSKAINTSFSDKFVYYPYELITSIHMKDDLRNGYSFYVQEIRRLNEITNLAKNKCSLILIDEILKGTNEKERLVIANAILKYLFKQNAMTIVSTHDITLAYKFVEADKYCFNDFKKDNDIVFDYLIKNGVCTVGNAVAIVKSLSFDYEIIKDIDIEKSE